MCIRRSASVLSPATNSMLFSEQPLFLIGPQFPSPFSEEVSLVAVLWLGAKVAGKIPTSCGWIEPLSLCHSPYPTFIAFILYRCGTSDSPGEGKRTTWVLEEGQGSGMGMGSGEPWSL